MPQREVGAGAYVHEKGGDEFGRCVGAVEAQVLQICALPDDPVEESHTVIVADEERECPDAQCEVRGGSQHGVEVACVLDGYGD